MYNHLKQNKFRPFNNSVVKQISIQLLNALKILEKNKIIHADIKPENILIKNFDGEKISVVLIDFGSATYINNYIHTYIQSRYYRAPEIILGLNYTTKTDHWSFACVIFELLIVSIIFI